MAMAVAVAVAVAVAGLRWRAAEAMLWRPQATAAAWARRGYASAEESGGSDGTRSNSGYEMEKELPLSTRFEKWMHKYKRTYKDEAEKAYRFEVFKDNVKFIDSDPDIRGVNVFADKRIYEVPTGYVPLGPLERGD